MDTPWQQYNTMRARFGLDADVNLSLDSDQVALAAQTSNFDIHRKMLPYLIHLSFKDTSQPAGTAYYLYKDKPYICTALHVAYEAICQGRELIAYYADGTTSAVTVVAPAVFAPGMAAPNFDTATDVAILKVDRNSTAATVRNATYTYVGEEVYIMGFSGMQLCFTKGMVSSFNLAKGTATAHADNGFSGGPIFNLRMDLVGMVQGGAGHTQGMTNQQVCFVPAAIIHAFADATFSMVPF